MPGQQQSINETLRYALLAGAICSFSLGDASCGHAAGGGFVTAIGLAIFSTFHAKYTGFTTLEYSEKIMMSAAIGFSAALQLGAILRLVNIHRLAKPSQTGPSFVHRWQTVGKGFLVGVAAALAASVVLGSALYVMLELQKPHMKIGLSRR